MRAGIVSLLALGILGGGSPCEAFTVDDALALRPFRVAEQSSPSYKVISTKDLKSLMDQGAPLVILDARTPHYDDGYRIPGAELLPYNSSPSAIQKAVPKKDSIIITYCANARCPLSKKLAERLVDLGYVNVIKYTGGMDAWERAGNNFEKSH